MYSLTESLDPLNIALCISGCPIFPSKYKLVNIITRIHSIILLLLLLPILYVDEAVGINETHPMFVHLIMRLWIFCFLFFAGLFIIQVWREKSRIRFILQYLEPTLTSKDHKDIFRYSLLLVLVTTLLPVVWRFVLSLCTSTFSLNQLGSLFIVFYSLLLSWFSMSVNMYVCILKVVHVSEKNVINRFVKEVTRIQDPKKMYRLLMKLSNIKKEISDSVSILPFYCFFYLFVETVATICRHQIVFFDPKSSAETKSFSIFSLFRSFNDLALVTYMTFKTDSFCGDSSLKLEKLKESIISRKDPHDWLFVVNKINESQQFEYQAFGFFKIDRKTLLSFFASFVPLSVLFVQLIINQTNTNTIPL